MRWNTLQEEVFYSLVISFLNQLLILNETSTRIRGRHHQDKNNIDRIKYKKVSQQNMPLLNGVDSVRIGWSSQQEN